MKLKTTLCSLALLLACGAYAHDFSATVDGQTLYFEITSKNSRTARVTYRGSIADGATPTISGVVAIPARVKHDNVTYTISAIGPKAFAGAAELTGIVMPQGITTIGDFAFEGCTALEKVVFPGNKVKLGQGVFFRCSAIKDVTIGSDWTSVDLAMFRWSDSLQVVTLPAKVEKVQNLKKLKHLVAVSVDPNNTHFTSHDGVLYNRDGTILYGVPRAFAGKLRVADGTTTIVAGAIADCLGITALYLPESVAKMAMRELAGLTALKTVAFRSKVPMVTGYRDGKAMLVVQVASNDVKIVVPNEAKKAYQEALATEAGEYAPSTRAGSVPFTIADGQLPTAKSIKAVKNFNDYE